MKENTKLIKNVRIDPIEDRRIELREDIITNKKRLVFAIGMI
jgi:hypothetical protein